MNSWHWWSADEDHLAWARLEEGLERKLKKIFNTAGHRKWARLTWIVCFNLNCIKVLEIYYCSIISYLLIIIKIYCRKQIKKSRYYVYKGISSTRYEIKHDAKEMDENDFRIYQEMNIKRKKYFERSDFFLIFRFMVKWQLFSNQLVLKRWRVNELVDRQCHKSDRRGMPRKCTVSHDSNDRSESKFNIWIEYMQNYPVIPWNYRNNNNRFMCWDIVLSISLWSGHCLGCEPKIGSTFENK
jgi:hypothetical protein